MKKNILKTMAVVCGVALTLAGCATVSDVKIDGKKAYFDTPVYGQGQTLVIGDYLYYSNAYVASNSEGFNYKQAAKVAGLSRINIKNGLKFESDVEDEDKLYTSPIGIETVVKDKLIGYQNQDMFAYGEYIYFTSANTHKTSDLEDDYSRVSLFRVKFNGDDLTEIVKNSAFKIGTGCIITLQKGSDNNYHYVIAETGSESGTYTLKSVKVGKNVGKVKTLAENVKSYAIADKDSTDKNIIYTVDSEQAQATTAVKAVDFASGIISDLDNGTTGSTMTLLGRSGDVVFYNYSTKTENEIYYQRTNFEGENGDNVGSGYFNPSVSQRFYTANAFSNLQKLGNGYIFKTSGGALMYKELSGRWERLSNDAESSDVLFVTNGENGSVGYDVYISTASSIKKITISESGFNEEIIISLDGTTIVSGQCGYDGEYIYYFGSLPETLFEDEDDTQKETDENNYLFRTDKFGNRQILGKRTKI